MSLVDEYTAALFDLDGVVYLGPAPVEGAPEGIRELKERGTKVAFVTNNAARSAAVVAEHLARSADDRVRGGAGQAALARALRSAAEESSAHAPAVTADLLDDA